MTKKVKISREQEKILKERISYYEQQGLNKNQIVSVLFDDKKSNGNFEGTPLHNMGTFDFMKILTGQYEVEQTPEEIIKEIYHFKYGSGCGEGYQPGVQYGIEKTLDILNIQIKGVNA